MAMRTLILATLVTCAACVSSPLTAASPSSVPSSSAPPSRSVVPLPAATTFIVPKPTTEPVVERTLAGASFNNPSPTAELQTVFELFYKARTLSPGGQFDVAALRSLVADAYADYTLPLFDREVRDAQAGVLQQVSFSAIAVSLMDFNFIRAPGARTAFIAHASVTRTRTELRAGASPTHETATYTFALRRELSGTDGVIWVVVDFVNPATGSWISELVPVTDAQVTVELKNFFADFYLARSLTAGHPLDLRHSADLVAGSYAAYTLPLLDQTRSEAASGALTEVRYADLAVRLASWDPSATNHGGLATVQVTRTSFVTRPAGTEPPQTATYQFRVHRHADQNGASWLAVDFFRPDVNRWVTDLAGATVIVPPAGHG